MRVLTRPNLGGPCRQAIALWHAHRELGVATLLVTGAVDATETLLSPAAAGIPQLSLAAAVAAGPAASGWVQIDGWTRGWLGSVLGRGDRRARAALRALLGSHRPDVVHTHTSKAGWLCRPLARAAAVPAIVHTFHGHVLRDYFVPPVAMWLRRLERRLAAITDVLVAVSGSCADELAAAGVAPRARFLVVPPAVAIAPPLPAAAAAAALGFAPGERRLCAVGRLVPIKRLQDFIDTIAALPDGRGDLVGDGPERAALAARIAARAPDRVRLLGARPGIAGELAAYEALLLPSRREGWPLVAIEAQAAAVPVVGYDVPGVRDALAAGGGVLVPPASGPAGLAAAVLALRQDPVRRAECVRLGKAAIDRFAPAAVAAVLRDTYAATLAARPRYHAQAPS
ncbi:MAG: glycosyltransferase family 4 protein [Planctomycetes bacterium]|nr:glycosyltransferase family 4 protein [Planctomycetota bacterium]